jgi:uncharacterized membrane protein
LAVGILLLGLVEATFQAVASARRNTGSLLERLTNSVLQCFRISLGKWTLAALGVLIVSDILHSTVHRSLQEMMYLASIVGIRIALAFFLDLEIQRMEASTRPSETDPT